VRFTVLLTARAIQDLEHARDYIRRSSPETADQWYRSFLEALLRLEENPELRSLAAENAAFPFELRQFLFRTKSRLANRALFTIVGDEVRILAIRRPGQPLITAGDV
jgi:plasmid stabilization system protein ParE